LAIAAQGRTAAVRDDAFLTRIIDMNFHSATVATPSPPATTDTGRIRLGGGWRLVPAKPAAR
jgi:hypothetical protein